MGGGGEVARWLSRGRVRLMVWRRGEEREGQRLAIGEDREGRRRTKTGLGDDAVELSLRGSSLGLVRRGGGLLGGGGDEGGEDSGEGVHCEVKWGGLGWRGRKAGVKR